MGKFSRGLFALSAGLALASQSPRAHACCGFDENANTRCKAAIRAELAELAPPPKFAFSFSDAVCAAAARGAKECSCNARCPCEPMTHRLHDDVVLAELDASTEAALVDGVPNPAASPAPFVQLAFAFSRGDSQRMHADLMDHELAHYEQAIGDGLLERSNRDAAMRVAFSFAENFDPGRVLFHFKLEHSSVPCRWPLGIGPKYAGAAFERVVVDLKKREHEIAAEFAAAAAYAMESDNDANKADIAAMERGDSTRCLATPQFPLNETPAFDDARMIEEQLVHPQASKECLLCEWSIDSPSSETQPLKQFYEGEWETSPNMPVYPAPPHVPNLIPSNHLVARKAARIHVAIEGAAMRFRDEGGALPVYR